MSGWFIYLLTRIYHIRGLLILFTFILFFCLIGCLVFTTTYSEIHFGNPFSETPVLKLAKKIAILMAIIIFITLMTPNLKEIAAIYVIPKIVNNTQCQKIPEKMINLLNTKLDQWSEESLGLKENSKKTILKKKNNN